VTSARLSGALVAWALAGALATHASASVVDARADALPAYASLRKRNFRSCRSVVRHGAATMELVEARRIAGDARGRPQVCGAWVTLLPPGRKPVRRTWNIDPAGAPFGVAVLEETIGNFRALAKRGDYDGRLLLLGEDGSTWDLPGPEYFVAHDRFLVTRHESDDGWDGVAVFDLRERRVIQELQRDALARLFGSRSGGPAGDETFLEVEGRIYLARTDAGARGLAGARLDAATGMLVPAAVPSRAARPIALKGTEGWRDCACTPAPAGTR
jgi:hypothetical protein